MAYILTVPCGLHILRRKPIELAELLALISRPAFRGATRDASGLSAANEAPSVFPARGEGRAATLPLPGFRYAEGAIHFTADFDLADAHHPVRVTASLLACLLDATIVGDDGQVYRW